MGLFVGKLRYDRIYDENNEFTGNIELITAFGYFSNKGEEIWCKKGFVSDGMSVPKACWWFEHPFGKGLKAGIIHDKIFRDPSINIGFFMANAIFAEALMDCGVSWWKAKTMQRLVDAFGWMNYKRRV